MIDEMTRNRLRVLDGRGCWPLHDGPCDPARRVRGVLDLTESATGRMPTPFHWMAGRRLQSSTSAAPATRPGFSISWMRPADARALSHASCRGRPRPRRPDPGPPGRGARVLPAHSASLASRSSSSPSRAMRSASPMP